ncbi:MAG: aldehyde dehydrogenase family protein [Sphingorhabdus sp.]
MTKNMPQQSEIARLFALHGRSHLTARTSSAEERRAKLLRFRAALLDHSQAICEAIGADLGRPAAMAKSAEVDATIAEIDLAVAQLDEWMAPAAVTPILPIPNGRAEIRAQSRGRVLVLGPWNFPVGLVLQPIVAAVAAGNTVIAKPNELSPASSAATTALLRAGFDEADVAVLEGGVDVAEALLALPFDHIFFTGSPAVGRMVMAAAARHLASVTLELGGKCPVVIGDDADVDAVAATVAGARCINAGQLCLAPDHVWVPRDRFDLFVSALTAQLRAKFHDDQGRFLPERVGRIINDRNFRRLSAYIDDAVAAGAVIHCGGGRDANALTIVPTVLGNVPLDATIMQEEIFGPILPVQPYDQLDEVLAYHRGRGKPLACYVFGRDQQFVKTVLDGIPSGGATINAVILHASDLGLPFGGVNESGIGRYHGVHGFRELSHERSVFIMP